MGVQAFNDENKTDQQLIFLGFFSDENTIQNKIFKVSIIVFYVFLIVFFITVMVTIDSFYVNLIHHAETYLLFVSKNVNKLNQKRKKSCPKKNGQNICSKCLYCIVRDHNNVARYVHLSVRKKKFF